LELRRDYALWFLSVRIDTVQEGIVAFAGVCVTISVNALAVTVDEDFSTIRIVVL